MESSWISRRSSTICRGGHHNAKHAPKRLRPRGCGGSIWRSADHPAARDRVTRPKSQSRSARSTRTRGGRLRTPLETLEDWPSCSLLLGFSQEKALRLAKRWFSYQDLMVERDAPYTFRSIALELFIRKVSEHWPWRGANRADFTYIHYLPFCDIFATNDTIQFNYAEVWRTPGQLIVDTTTLRDELAEIERLRATSERSVMDLPPPESTGIFATAMDQIRPDWRSQAVKTATSSSTGAPGESKLVEKLTKRIDRAIARGTRVPARYGTKGESKPDG